MSSWKGRHVEFVLKDVHLPVPLRVLDQLCGGDPLHGHGFDLLAGEVVDETDNGFAEGAFVLVRCDRLREPCLVAVRHVKTIG